MTFTEDERRFLAGQRLGRIATVSRTGEPDVAPVGFRLVGEAVEVGGFDNTKTRKYHNVKATGRASFVVDDLTSVDPWRPRGVKVTGRAEIDLDDRGKPLLRVHPETVWSWGINEGAEKVFAVVEKRTV